MNYFIDKLSKVLLIMLWLIGVIWLDFYNTNFIIYCTVFSF